MTISSFYKRTCLVVAEFLNKIRLAKNLNKLVEIHSLVSLRVGHFDH